MKKLAIAISLVLCASLACASSAFAVDTSTRTASEIQARYSQLRPVYSGSPFASSPTLSAPYAGGSLSGGFVQDGVNALNYVRYLAGMPDDVVADGTMNSDAQAGAVLLAVSDYSHTPSKPADMDTTFYNTARAATSSSNIGWGDTNLASFTYTCVGDADSVNIVGLGHRRWILTPDMGKTGMGYASQRSVMKVMDRSRTAADYDTIKWPSAGYFPVEMMNAYSAWSVQLNPTKYRWTSGSAGHSAVLRRVSDNKTWTFDSSDTDVNGEYFNFSERGFGVSNCFIFRPSPASVGGYNVDDVFEVTLSGGITNAADGSPATITYRTTFISQTGASAGTAASGTASSGTPSSATGASTAAAGSGMTTLKLKGARSVRARHRYTLKGKATGANRVKIKVMRHRAGKWRVIRSTSRSAKSFKFRFTPKRRGTYKVIVKVNGLTATKRVRVK